MVGTGRVVRWEYRHIQDSGWCARTTLGKKRVALLRLNNPQVQSPQPSSYLSCRRNCQTHLRSSTNVWVFTTATCVLIASSVWEPTVNNSRTKTTERTLNTRRILLKSDLQAGVRMKNRESSFRLPCLMTFLQIFATALKSDQRCRQRGTQIVHYWRNSRRELIDCFNHRIVKLVQPLPLQSPVEGDTNISAGQSR